ncbi:P-loop containing nucleoside triphosphate hydrolase protein, partial [Atractiella rhizophila]
IIATPGRLLHVLVEMSLSLQNCSYVVFDEADRLFELNFSVQLYEILTRLPPSPIRQTLLFSATLPKTLVEFAKAGLQNPKLVRLDVESKISEDLQMAFLAMREEEKEAALFVLLRDVIGIEPSSNGGGTHQASSDEEGDGERNGRKNGIRKGKKVEKKSQKKEEKQAIIFCSTKHHVEYLNALLISQYTVSTIYSSLDQVARRSHLSAFRDGRTQLLVVTDLAARGIDIPALDNVINFDFPPAPRAFVHRVGRTARAGRGGWAYSFVCGRGEAGYLYDLELFLSRRVQTSFEGEVNYQSNLLLGSFDRETMDEEVERVKELVGDKLGTTARLQQVAQRGRKAFEKGRAKPSNESTRRAKDLDLSSLKLHPVFRTSNISNDGGTVPRKTVSSHVMKGKEELLDKIKNFNARETVFEFGKKGEKTEAGVLMKKRRRELEGKVMKAAKRRKEEEAVSTLVREKEVVDEDKDELELEMAEEADLEDVFDMELPSKTARRNTNFREENYYLGYVQPGADTEKGYSMRDTSTFAAAAQAATFDLSGTREGDEIVDRPQKASIMRWDRRQKKLVKGDGTGADNKKMIRSESGKKIPASFKSGMFEEWKGKKKLKVPKVGERELEGVKSTAKKWRHSQVKEKKGLKGKGAGKGSGKSELKNVATIRKERAAKAKRKERSNQPSRKK